MKKAPPSLPGRALGPGLAVLALALGTLVFPYTVDDAYVIARYAERLAHGLGYTFVDGPPTDGVTGPPFVLFGALASLSGWDAILAAKVVGLASAAASVHWVVQAARRRVVGGLAAPVAGAFLLLAPSYLLWSVSGLETGLAALASIVLAAAVGNEPRPVHAGLAAALLIMLRPECIPLAGALLSYLWRRRGMPWAKGQRASALLPMIGLLSIVSFRWVLFGTLGPLSAAAKPPDLEHGLVYAFRILTYGTALVALPPAIYAAVGSRRMRVLGVSILVHLLAIILAGGDWMPGVRLFVPALPLLAWMVGVGISDLARRRPGPAFLVAAVAVVLAVPGALFLFEMDRAREAAVTQEREGRALSAYLDAHAETVALVDIGFLTYAGHFTPVDLAGITDPSIGRLAGGHVDKPVTGAMLIERGVDAIVLHSSTEPRVDEAGRLTALSGHPVERRLAMDESIRRVFEVRHVVRYAEAYYYVVLLPRERALEPAPAPRTE